MGLDYTYEVVAELRSADSLVRVLAKHLVARDRQRLLAALGASPESIMRRIQRRDLELELSNDESHDLCFAFLFPSDQHLVAYGSIRQFDDPQSGRLAIGCVWSSIRCGERYALFRATAATTDMSLLFQESRSIRETFVQIGREAGAALVVFDEEKDDRVGIWPREGRMANSIGPDDFLGPVVEPHEIDRYCSALVAGAGIE